MPRSDTYGDEGYSEEDAALMKRPSYMRFASAWLWDDAEWRRLENSGDEDGADERAAACADQILYDYRKHISE